MRDSKKNLSIVLLCLLVCGMLALLCGCSQQSAPETVELPQPVEGMVQLQNNTGNTVTGLEYRTMEQEEYTAITLEEGTWLSGNWIRFDKLEEYQDQPFALRLTFEDGSSLELDGLFVALGSAGAVDLARKIGALTDGRSIQTDENMATNVPGLYAAGDCTGGLLQISTAVGEGAKAAMSMIKFVRQQKKG